MSTERAPVTDPHPRLLLPALGEAIQATSAAYEALTALKTNLPAAINSLRQAHAAALRAYQLTAPSYHPLDFPRL
jgi:hypothetical protein